MARKYEQVIKERNLARHLGTDKNRQAILDEIKKALIAGVAPPSGIPDLGLAALDSPMAISDAYCLVRVNKEEIDERLKKANMLLEAVMQLMYVSFEKHGVSQLDLIENGKISVYPEPYLKIVDKEEFRLWCLAENLDKSMKIDWQKANSILKQRLIEGQAEPAGTEAKFRDIISWRRNG